MTTLQPNPSHYHDPFEEDSIDFKRYISLFINNWYWFVISLFIALSIAYSINRWSEEVFTVSSTLLIKDDQNTSLANIFPGSDAFRNQQNVNNEIGVLKSFNLNYRVMRDLPDFYIDYVKIGKRNIAESRQYKDSPFLVLYSSLQNQITGKIVKIRILSDEKYRLEINGNTKFQKELTFGQRFHEMGFDFVIELRDGGNFVFDPDDSNKYYFYFNGLQSLANRYRSKLSISPVSEEASLVTLSTTGNSLEQEVDYLNKLMDVYLEFGLDFKNETAVKTISFIEEQLGVISDSLQIAEKALENFRLTNRLIDISTEGTIVKEKLKQIDDQKTSLQLQENYFSYLKEYIESKTENEDIVAPSVMEIIDPTLVRLVGELSEQQKEKQRLSMNLDRNMEPLRLLEAGIARTRNAISENIKSGLQNIGRTKNDLEIDLKNVEREIRLLPSTERQLINIQRKFDINNTVYTFLLEKRAEASIARASNVSDNRIIDYAGYHSASQIRPRKAKNFRMAFLLGILFPFGGILLLDILNNKIIDRKDIERRTSVPLVGYISHNSLQTDLPVAENPGSTLSESFRSVRTSLKYFLKEKDCKVISVSSTISAEGKTFISTNLATIIAMSDKKVLLVGLDLRKPRIHKIFGIDNQIGISTFLIGEEGFDNIIFKTKVDNLWYAPSGPVPPNPAELIDSELMVTFFEKAKKQFDYIIIDTPPVAIVTDALLVEPFTDFYLFVVRQRYSLKNTIDLIEEIRKNGSIKSMGIVINDISLSGYYGYGLRYGYSMGYGYNYGYNYYDQYGKYGYSDSAKGYYKDVE